MNRLPSGNRDNLASRHPRRVAVVGCALLVMAVAAPSRAEAQNCTLAGSADALLQSFNPNLASGGGAAAGALLSVLSTMNTAFLTQTNAFVGSPPNPPADSSNGGAWIRGIGGYTNTSSTVTSSSRNSNPAFAGPPPVPAQNFTGMAQCNVKIHETYGGFQVGQDLARLNVGGWNFHGGVTAGYVESKVDATDFAFSGTFQAPFAGVYAAATKGGFFIDGLARWDSYEGRLNFPAGLLTDHAFDARAFSLGASTGYNISLESWFFEPSAGIIYSRLSADPISAAGTILSNPISGVSTAGTTTLDTVQSVLGRLGLRAGTTVSAGNFILQPFGAVSLWHEFAGDASGSSMSCNGCAFVGAAAPNHVPVTLSGTLSASRIGSYGQFALGVAGQLVNTGWLGYVRADLKEGPQVEGIGVNAGLRYQFDQEQRPVRASKAPLYKAPPMPQLAVYNWTGFYLGGVVGAMRGSSDWTLAENGSGVANRFGGLLGGVEAGYNYQIGSSWVLGIDGDIAWTNARGNQTGPSATSGDAVTSNPPSTFPFGLPPSPFAFGTTPTCTSRIDLTCRESVDWIGTLTGRLGYGWGGTLLYVKGGGAYVKGTDEIFDTYPLVGAVQTVGPICFCVLASASDNRVGWALGAGFEYAYNRNWSVKAEYLYLDFGSRILTLSDGEHWNISRNFSQTKLGINYHFSPSVIAAAY
jgi:opacity protein-like surface antigen